MDRLKELRAEQKENMGDSTEPMMRSACWEYACPCHDALTEALSIAAIALEGFRRTHQLLKSENGCSCARGEPCMYAQTLHKLTGVESVPDQSLGGGNSGGADLNPPQGPTGDLDDQGWWADFDAGKNPGDGT